MTFKKERMEKIMERELGNILLSDVKDDRLKFVTITKVDLTNDLSIATVYFSVLGSETQIEATIHTLQEAKGFIRSVLSKRIEVKKTPELRFKYDESFAQGNKIEEILKNIHSDNME